MNRTTMRTSSYSLPRLARCNSSLAKGGSSALSGLRRAATAILSEACRCPDTWNGGRVHLRDTNDVNYVIDYLTNRYSKVDDANITYDQAGSLAVDKDGYGYEYDYENR
ncbi:MAG: hypothetical protein ACYTBJ_25640, partial [Planctomycetota bacterium]